MPLQFERIPELATDGEFRLAARFWTGSLTLAAGEERWRVELVDGDVTRAAPATAEPETSPGHVSVSAPVEVWEQMLAATPHPFFHDLFAAQAHGVALGGDFETSCQYYPAMRRLVELLREEA